MNNKQEKRPLSSEQIRLLKKSAHSLKPVVQVGKKGISDSLIEEILVALKSHELIKVQFLASQKENIKRDTDLIVEKTAAELIMSRGLIITIFLAREE